MGVEEATQSMVEAVRGIPDLRVFDYPPDTLQPPAAVFGFAETIDQFETLHPIPGGGCQRWPIPIIVVLGRSTERTARATFEAIQREITRRILGLDRRELLHVHERAIGEVRPMQIGGGSYWTTRLVFEVWA